MKAPNYLTRRGKQRIYYARLRVPQELVGLLGRREFIRSLKTADLRVAQKLARSVLNEWERSFEQARTTADLNSTNLSVAAREYYERALHADENARAKALSPSEIEHQKSRAVKALRKAAQEGEFEWEDRFALLVKSLDYPALLDSKDWGAEALDIRVAELRSHLSVGETVLVRPKSKSIFVNSTPHSLPIYIPIERALGAVSLVLQERKDTSSNVL